MGKESDRHSKEEMPTTHCTRNDAQRHSLLEKCKSTTRKHFTLPRMVIIKKVIETHGESVEKGDPLTLLVGM